MPLTCSASSFHLNSDATATARKSFLPHRPLCCPHPIPDSSSFCFSIITPFNLGCHYVRTGLSPPLDQRGPKSPKMASVTQSTDSSLPI